jgi:hypothetical protein
MPSKNAARHAQLTAGGAGYRCAARIFKAFRHPGRMLRPRKFAVVDLILRPD